MPLLDEACWLCGGDGVESGDAIVSGTTSSGAEGDMLSAYERDCGECGGTGRQSRGPHADALAVLNRDDRRG